MKKVLTGTVSPANHRHKKDDTTYTIIQPLWSTKYIGYLFHSYKLLPENNISDKMKIKRTEQDNF